MDQQDALTHRVKKLEWKCLSLQLTCLVLVFCILGLAWIAKSIRHVLWETVKSNTFAVYDEDESSAVPSESTMTVILRSCSSMSRVNP